jgi:hypothetical protein
VTGLIPNNWVTPAFQTDSMVRLPIQHSAYMFS